MAPRLTTLGGGFGARRGEPWGIMRGMKTLTLAPPVGLLLLLIASCRPPLVNVEAVAQSHRCEMFLRRNCAPEAVTCSDDPARAISEDGARCMCLLGCRLLRHAAAPCVAHCGAADAQYTALASCLDASPDCSQPKETP